MLAGLRTTRWQSAGRWSRVVGVVLLLVGFFAPLEGLAALAATIPGILLFLFGALAWLVRDAGSWFRPG